MAQTVACDVWSREVSSPVPGSLGVGSSSFWVLTSGDDFILCLGRPGKIQKDRYLCTAPG